MSFSHAKVKALREASQRREGDISPATTSPVDLGVVGGESVG